MYQFTTTTIINSNLDSNGTTAKYSGNSTAFTVTRVNTFKKANILGVYKRPYTAGVKEVAQVTIPTIASGTVARVTIDVRLSQSTNSEYANSFLYFKKPVVVEVIATGTASTDATALKNQINGLKDRYGFSYVTATTSGANLILTATDNFQRFHSIIVEKEKASTNSIVQPEYENVTSTTFAINTAGKVGFGDDEHMIKSLMIPTLENTRFLGINSEERPILGGNYTQYVLRYSVDKAEDGIVAGAKSITNHVFYVKSDLVSGFESALINTGIAIDTIGATVSAVSITSGNLDISEVTGTDDYQITYSTTPSGVSGAVFTLNTSASTVSVTDPVHVPDWTKVTVSPTGMIAIAASHALVAGDKIAVNVSIDGSVFVKEITLA